MCQWHYICTWTPKEHGFPRGHDPAKEFVGDELEPVNAIYLLASCLLSSRKLLLMENPHYVLLKLPGQGRYMQVNRGNRVVV